MAKLAFRVPAFVISSVVDEHGTKLFTMDDLPAIGAMGIGVVELIVKAAQELSVMTDDDFASLVGNCETPPASGSPSSSPAQ